jgi:hypothetical protein
VLGTAASPLAGAKIDWQHVRRQQLAGACFVLCLLAPLALLTILARNGLPQYWSMMAAGVAIAALAISLPFHLTRRFASDKECALWLGPLTILAGLIALLPTYLHGTGLWIIGIAALVSVAALLPQIRVRAVWAWAAILIAATLYLAIEIGGNKYVNFFADRLALFGRTDGDIFAEGAIVGSIISYGWPSMAIDGLAPLKYHVGSLWVSARLAQASDAQFIPSGFIAALVATKIFVLVPLLIWAALQATILIHAMLRPSRVVGATCLAAALGIVIFAVPYAGLGLASFNSETMSLGAALALLVFPGAFLLAGDPANSARRRHWAWAFAALALFPVSSAKISMGFVLATLFGWWLLRLEGPRRLAFWLWGGIGFLAFLAAFLMFNDSGSMGATFFGKPYYVEYGFERGEWWLPVTFQIETIAALLALAFMALAQPARRLTIETLIVAALAGNLPGLLMYIQSGNAAYFLISQAWIAIPILAALLPAIAEAIGARLRGFNRFAPAAASVLLVAVIGYASYSEVRTRGALFVDANALLRSGDLTYYADDKRRAWRDGAKRALKEFGLAKVLTMPAAMPTGMRLARQLHQAAYAAKGTTLLYVPSDNTEFWSLVIDCDGKSLYPVAIAGLAMINGYVPKQSDCPQEIALRGFGIPPDVRVEETRESVCVRARQKGASHVVWLGSSEEILDCTPIQF